MSELNNLLQEFVDVAHAGVGREWLAEYDDQLTEDQAIWCENYLDQLDEEIKEQSDEDYKNKVDMHK